MVSVGSWLYLSHSNASTSPSVPLSRSPGLSPPRGVTAAPPAPAAHPLQPRVTSSSCLCSGRLYPSPGLGQVPRYPGAVPQVQGRCGKCPRGLEGAEVVQEVCRGCPAGAVGCGRCPRDLRRCERCGGDAEGVRELCWSSPAGAGGQGRYGRAAGAVQGGLEGAGSSRSRFVYCA